MKSTLLLVALCLALGLASAFQLRHQGVLINQPYRPEDTQVTEVKREHPKYDPQRPLELYVTKGEYVCGNKICKLEPGVVPKGCHGICQYPVLL